MTITYNNLDEPSNILTFTEVPNILKVEEYVSGTKASISLVFEGNIRQSVTADSQYYISILGETVTNVMDASMANNKRFFISSDEDSTAMSVCRALRNCSSLNADFNIIRTGTNTVSLIARTIGSKGLTAASAIQSNLPDGNFTAEVTEGTSSSSFFNSKIDIDVYSSSTIASSYYVTTLEKNWYGDSCSFDVSPLLATISRYGYTQPYTLSLELIGGDGECSNLGSVSGNTTIGYHANQSLKYMTAEGAQMLINKDRGSDGTMKLYTYSSTIPYTVLCGLDTGGWDAIISVKDSAFNEVWNSGRITQRRTTSNMIVDTSVTVPQSAFTDGYYVDLTIGSETTRFNIIKPLKATEYSQRVLWRNEYGGISFFDFTGNRSESDSVNIETYEKNVFDYYDTEYFEKKMIYSNEYKKTVSLTSHLMEEDGKWIFNSLMRSKKVWTTVNGNTYYIIPKSIEVAEDQSYNGIYTAKLTYEYSDI